MPTAEPLRVVSYGGGVQSTALLVLAAQGYIDHDVFLFSNVGDDSEHPATLRYVREVAFDYAAQHGIRMEELHRVPQRGAHRGKPETLYGRLMREDSRSLPIPVRMPDTGAPGTRSCTADFKIRVVQRWVREHGASADNPCRTAIGISTDEYERATSRITEPYEVLEYPLLHLEWKGRTGLSRNDCANLIRSAGLPVPPKSSCYFCPFLSPGRWSEMRRDEPDLFDQAAFLEQTLNDRRGRLACPGEAKRPLEGIQHDDLGAVVDRAYDPADGAGTCPTCRVRVPLAAGGVLTAHARGPVYLTRFGRPLPDAIAAAQQGLFDPGWEADDGHRCGDVCDT